jgi:hypothetical protein
MPVAQGVYVDPDGKIHAIPLRVDETGRSLTVLSAGEAHLGQIGGHIALASASFTRPNDTTAYASGDLIASATAAGSVVPLSFAVARTAGGSGMIRRARLRKTSAGLSNANFRLHLYRNVAITLAAGDNGAWLSDQVANYMGAIDLVCDKAFSDGASGNGTPNTGSEINFVLPSGTAILGLLEARAAYAPAALETFTLELEVVQN